MKRFLQAVLMVLGVLMVISIPFDYLFSNYLITYSKAQKYVGWNDIIYDSINADLVVLGSSRAWVQYDTYIIDSMLQTNSYNLGIDGSPLNRQMLKYKIYSHFQSKSPKVMIVNIDFWSVSRRTGYQRDQFFPYLLNRYTRNEFIKDEPFSIGELFLPMFRYYKQGVYSVYLESNIDHNLFKGYAGMDWEWDGSGFSRISSFHFNKDEAVAKEFDDFLKELKNQKVRIVFVCAPLYFGITKIVDNLFEYYETIQSYSDKYEIPILDYFNYYLSYDTTYFYNAMHLNKTGAELFTIQLCHDLDSLGILLN